MMKQQFKDIKLRHETRNAIETANTIIREYQAQGFTLTLRQLYYQHVSRGLIPNTEQSYKRMGDLISNGRLAGMIDWAAIEDRTRNLQRMSSWNDPSEIINSAYRSFKLDRWKDQTNRVECWVEKDALIGVIEGVCTENDVPYFACRGYTSQSELYDAARRIARHIQGGQEVTILHLGDHDPSGIDMTRDIQDRLDLFLDGLLVDVDRLALNWNQVVQYAPPPNPAKATDSRFIGYEKAFGGESWELDALEPRVIRDLIETHILALRDDARYQATIDEEEHHKAVLKATADRWTEVATYLEDTAHD